MADLPEFYFRVRDNGAAVFRIDTQNQHRRLDMEQIAVLNIRNGEIKPQGQRPLSEAERAAIEGWMEARRATLAAREMDEIRRVVEQINRTAHWAQSRAAPEELEAVSDDLLLAMHDLRSVLVRKKADRLSGTAG